MRIGMSVFDANSVERRAYCFLTKVERLKLIAFAYFKCANCRLESLHHAGNCWHAGTNQHQSSELVLAEPSVLFRTDAQLRPLVDRQFWKSRLFGGLP